MARLIVIGDRASPRERKVIRDRDGPLEVDVGFDTSPDYYRSLGICRINGDIYHMFEF